MAPAAPTEDVTGQAPTLSGRDLDGKRFKLEAALEEGPVILTFWTTWCRPCRKEMPELQRLREKYKDSGLRVVAVSGDSPVDQAKVKPFIRSQKFDFVVLIDTDGDIRRRYQVEVYPTTFLVTGDGRMIHRNVGYRRGDEKILEAQIQSELGLEPETPEEPGDDG